MGIEIKYDAVNFIRLKFNEALLVQKLFLYLQINNVGIYFVGIGRPDETGRLMFQLGMFYAVNSIYMYK